MIFSTRTKRKSSWVRWLGKFRGCCLYVETPPSILNSSASQARTKNMPIYRCKNFGGCPIADSRKDIELPPGSIAACSTPGCPGPLVEVGTKGGSKRKNGENNGPRLPWVW